VLGRRDALVFPQVAVGRRDLLHPFRGAADSHPDAESLSGADRDAVRPVCLDMADAIPEDRQGRSVRLVWGAGKLAGREPRLADAVLAHPAPAWAECLGLPAWVGLVGRWAQRRAVAALCTQDEALSAA
jgi:hypothetical protein